MWSGAYNGELGDQISLNFKLRIYFVYLDSHLQKFSIHLVSARKIFYPFGFGPYQNISWHIFYLRFSFQFFFKKNAPIIHNPNFLLVSPTE